jgi:hypothetical protein
MDGWMGGWVGGWMDGLILKGSLMYTVATSGGFLSMEE